MHIGQIFKFLLALIIATLVMLAVRTFIFTIYTVPNQDWRPDFEAGDRVVVNRISNAPILKGDIIAFTDTVKITTNIGRVLHLPGDTIKYGKELYRIPLICCRRCGCKDCKLYLVRIGKQRVLVHKHQIIGKAKKLYHLKF